MVQIYKLREHPTYKEEAANWFHDKWGIPAEDYAQSIEECIVGNSIPQWYVAIDDNKIIGGIGVIENDFHTRKDLSPNVCALYVEESYFCIRQYKYNKQILSEEELSQEQFCIRYKSLEEANFIKLDDTYITKEEYDNLKGKDKKRAIRQEASMLNRPLLDSHGHMIVKHDLFNYEGLTQDGIAEAFIGFAKSENLSFWRK